MRKLFFCIATFLVFSFSSLAENIDEYTLDFKVCYYETENFKIQVEMTNIDCYQVAEDVVAQISAEVGGLTSEEAYDIFSTAYDICVNTGLCNNCLREIVLTP
jgi:energy-converting hydrogenase A subunit M